MGPASAAGAVRLGAVVVAGPPRNKAEWGRRFGVPSTPQTRPQTRPNSEF